MEFRIEEILWYLIFIDSVFANLIIWLFPKWYEKNLKIYLSIFLRVKVGVYGI